MAVVDVDGLFRKFTIPEVQEIEKKVKADIERKKEDLRQMVGRRYRDIIEAADSIKEMQISSEQVLTSIRHIERSVDSLHNIQQQLVVASHRAKMNTNVAASINLESSAKFIADLLELAFENLNEKLPLDAAWCFIIADHLYGTWKLNYSHRRSENRDMDAAAASFLALRFANVALLRRSIVEAAATSISDCSSAFESVLDAVCALTFMERTNLALVFQRFLQCRSTFFRSIFSSSDLSSREQICLCLSVLQRTILQIHQLFVSLGDGPNGSNRTLDKMRNLVASRWQPDSMSQFEKRQSRLFNVLIPDNFDYSKIFFLSPVVEVDQVELSRAVQVWLKESLDFGNGKLNELITNFDTIESLAVLKENMISALEAEPSESFDWSTACQKVLGEDLSLWRILAASLLEGRAKELVKLNVVHAFETLTDFCNDKVSDNKDKVWPGFAVAKDSWHELRTDTIILGDFSTLQLKARGLTQDVYQPVADLDKKISLVDTALTSFISIYNSGRPFELNRFPLDDAQLQNNLADCCISSVERLIDKITKEALVWDEALSNKDHDEGMRSAALQRLVSWAKFIQCLGDSSGALRNCVFRIFNSDGKSKNTELDKWSNLRVTLHNCASTLYRYWADYTVGRVASSFHEHLLESTTSIPIWLDYAQEWEAVELEEETEEGQKVLSTIFVPAACSNYVSALLHNINRHILDIGAHSLPSDILSLISKSMRSAAVRSFEAVVSRIGGPNSLEATSGVKLCQKQAIQLLFDFNVLTQLLSQSSSSSTSRDENLQMNERVQQVINKLEALVDPFDLDVLKPRLKRNIIKVLQKFQALYRILYSPDLLRSFTLAGKLPAPTTSASDTAQLLPLSVCQTRFYLLPLVTDSEKTSQASGRASSSHALSSSTVGPRGQGDRDKTASPRHPNRGQAPGTSFASTFYDKLSSSWFGGTN